MLTIRLFADSPFRSHFAFYFYFYSIAAASQSMSTPRLSGYVPGGRGIGTVDVEVEESHDTKYRARVRSAVDALGPLTTQEAFANDTTMDGISMPQLYGKAPTKSRAESVKMTPSSSAEAKRGSMSTPMTVSATGAFVDYVIKLPADVDEDDDLIAHMLPVGLFSPTSDGTQSTTQPAFEDAD